MCCSHYSLTLLTEERERGEQDIAVASVVLEGDRTRERSERQKQDVAVAGVVVFFVVTHTVAGTANGLRHGTHIVFAVLPSALCWCARQLAFVLEVRTFELQTRV